MALITHKPHKKKELTDAQKERQLTAEIYGPGILLQCTGKLKLAVEKIFERFEQEFNTLDKKEKADGYIDANDFEQMMVDLDISKPLFTHAKQLLKIKSEKRGNRWVWLFPQIALYEAQQPELNDRLKQMKENQRVAEIPDHRWRQSTMTLMDYMKQVHHFDAPALTVLSDMESSGYSRVTAMRAKKLLQIQSVLDEGRWHWVGYDEEVVSWLETKLENGKVSEKEIFRDAMEHHHWTSRVIRVCRRMSMNQIRDRWARDPDGTLIHYWFDVNAKIGVRHETYQDAQHAMGK